MSLTSLAAKAAARIAERMKRDQGGSSGVQFYDTSMKIAETPDVSTMEVNTTPEDEHLVRLDERVKATRGSGLTSEEKGMADSLYRGWKPTRDVAENPKYKDFLQAFKDEGGSFDVEYGLGGPESPVLEDVGAGLGEIQKNIRGTVSSLAGAGAEILTDPFGGKINQKAKEAFDEAYQGRTESGEYAGEEALHAVLNKKLGLPIPWSPKMTGILAENLVMMPGPVVDAALASRGITREMLAAMTKSEAMDLVRVITKAGPVRANAGSLMPSGAGKMGKGMSAEDHLSSLGLDAKKIAAEGVPKEGIRLKYREGSPYKGEFKLTGFTSDGKFVGIDNGERVFEVSPKFNGKPIFEHTSKNVGRSVEANVPKEATDLIPAESFPGNKTIQEKAADRIAAREAKTTLQVKPGPTLEQEAMLAEVDENVVANQKIGLEKPAGRAEIATPEENATSMKYGGSEQGRLKPMDGATGSYEEADILHPKGTSQPIEIAPKASRGSENVDDVLLDVLQEKPRPRKADVDAMIEARGPNKVGVPLEVSKARIAAAMTGVQPKTAGQKIVEGAQNFVNRLTRQFEHLPRGEHGALKFGMNKLAASRSYANGEAMRLIDGTMGGLSMAERRSLAEKVMSADFFEDLQRGKQIPFDFEEGSFLKWKKGVDAANPHLDALVKKDKEIVNGLVENLIVSAKENGADLSFLRNRPDYFRHQVLDHMIEGGNVERVPGINGSLKVRAGTGKDINAHYAQSRFETMQNLLKDAEWFRFQKTLRETEDAGAEFRALAKRTGKRLEDVVPDGYVVRDYLGEKYRKFQDPVGGALNDVLSQVGNAENAARLAGAEPLVLKENVAKTVDEFFTSQATKPGLFRKATGAWKWWRLNNPKTAPMYHIRNTTGDVEGALNHPSAFGEAKTAYQHLVDVVVHKKEPDAILKGWMQRGGFSTFERIQELQQLGKLKEFQQVIVNEGLLDKAVRAGTAPFKKYKDVLDKFGDIREGILRYADYRATLKELEASGGKFATHGQYGASIKEEVDAIKDLGDRAFKISNERMGAYDTMTVYGKKLRETIAPFWSWKEANAKRTYGILRNAMRDGKAGGVAASFGKAMGAKTVGGAVAVGRAVTRLAIPTALLTAYNKTVMGDVEKDLPDYIRNRPHLNLGRDSEGKTRYIDGIGAFGDLLSWAGVDTNSGLVRDWINGRGTMMDVLNGVLKAPVNVGAQSLNPIIKTAVVVATGQDFYPDAFHPRQIRDTTKYIFDQVAMGEEYAALRNIPQDDGYAGTWKKLLFKKIDPDAGAYNETQATVNRFLQKKGKESAGGAYSERQNDLFYHKLAVRYGDAEKAEYWANKYFALGGTPEDIGKSVNAMAPEKRIPKELRNEFFDSLDASEREKFDRAERFWQEVIKGKQLNPEQAADNAAKNGVQENIHRGDDPKPTERPASSSDDLRKRAAERMRQRSGK